MPRPARAWNRRAECALSSAHDTEKADARSRARRPARAGKASRGSDSGRAAGAPPQGPRDQELARLPLDLLQRGRYQPRMDMRPETLQHAGCWIRAQGVVQPIVVRPIGAAGARRGEQRYEIIAGERRWRAAQQAGLTEIPAIIRQVPDDAAIAMALIENIQRGKPESAGRRPCNRLADPVDLLHLSAGRDAVRRSRAAVSLLFAWLGAARLWRLRLTDWKPGLLYSPAAQETSRSVRSVVVRRKGWPLRLEAVRHLVDPANPAYQRCKVAIDPNIQRPRPLARSGTDSR